MERRSFLQACVASGAASAMPSLAGASRRPHRIKVFGVGSVALELSDYSRVYVPDAATRPVENIFVHDLFRDRSIDYVRDIDGNTQIHLDGNAADSHVFAPVLIERLKAYVSDADILIGVADLAEPNRLVATLFEAAAKLAESPAVMKLVLAVSPFSFKGESYRLRARAELEMLEANYDRVHVISSDKVLKGGGDVLLEHANAAVDSLSHEATKVLVGVIARSQIS